jgi:hypothetical protein
MFPTPKNISFVLNPFGSIMVSVSKGEYRYGMNTQEKDNEIYGEGNSYSAEYWQYDARLGRRWNVDPYVVKHPYNSPYLCFNNNPNFYVDIKGNEFEEGSKKDAEDLMEIYKKESKELKKVQNKNSKKITDLNEKLLSAKNEDDANKLQNQISKLEGYNNKIGDRLCELDRAKTEWGEMNESEQKFRIKLGEKAVTYMDDGVVVMIYTGHMDLLGHEFVHGYQYIKQKISFNLAGPGGWLYDMGDEVEAYKRQWAINPLSVNGYGFENYNDITKESVANIREGPKKKLIYDTTKIPMESMHGGVTIEFLIKNNPIVKDEGIREIDKGKTVIEFNRTNNSQIIYKEKSQ